MTGHCHIQIILRNSAQKLPPKTSSCFVYICFQLQLSAEVYSGEHDCRVIKVSKGTPCFIASLFLGFVQKIFTLAGCLRIELLKASRYFSAIAVERFSGSFFWKRGGCWGRIMYLPIETVKGLWSLQIILFFFNTGLESLLSLIKQCCYGDDQESPKNIKM